MSQRQLYFAYRNNSDEEPFVEEGLFPKPEAYLYVVLKALCERSNIFEIKGYYPGVEEAGTLGEIVLEHNKISPGEIILRVVDRNGFLYQDTIEGEISGRTALNDFSNFIGHACSIIRIDFSEDSGLEAA